MYPKVFVGGYDKGADIKGGAGLCGYPVPVNAYKGLYSPYKILLRHRRDAEALTGVSCPLGVPVRPEKQHPSVIGTVGLQALEHLLGIVEDHSRGGKAYWGIGDYPGVVPALALVIVHNVHMVGENLPEAQLVLIGLFLGGGGAFNLDIKHDKLPSLFTLLM